MEVFDPGDLLGDADHVVGSLHHRGPSAAAIDDRSIAIETGWYGWAKSNRPGRPHDRDVVGRHRFVRRRLDSIIKLVLEVHRWNTVCDHHIMNLGNAKLRIYSVSVVLSQAEDACSFDSTGKGDEIGLLLYNAKPCAILGPWATLNGVFSPVPTILRNGTLGTPAVCVSPVVIPSRDMRRITGRCSVAVLRLRCPTAPLESCSRRRPVGGQ